MTNEDEIRTVNQSVYLTKKEYDELTEYAKAENRTRSVVLRMAMVAYLKAQHTQNNKGVK